MLPYWIFYHVRLRESWRGWYPEGVKRLNHQFATPSRTIAWWILIALKENTQLHPNLDSLLSGLRGICINSSRDCSICTVAGSYIAISRRPGESMAWGGGFEGRILLPNNWKWYDTTYWGHGDSCSPRFFHHDRRFNWRRLMLPSNLKIASSGIQRCCSWIQGSTSPRCWWTFGWMVFVHYLMIIFYWWIIMLNCVFVFGVECLCEAIVWVPILLWVFFSPGSLKKSIVPSCSTL